MSHTKIRCSLNLSKRYSVNQIFVKGYGFFSFSKNTGKIVIKILSGTYSQKFLDYTKHPATEALKTVSKRIIQKRAEATVDLIANKIADEIEQREPSQSQAKRKI